MEVVNAIRTETKPHERGQAAAGGKATTASYRHEDKAIRDLVDAVKKTATDNYTC